MKNSEPDIDIEINYDAELEQFGSSSDAGDARFIRVWIEDRNIIPGSLKLEPPAAEDQTSGEFLVCPVQVRANTADYTEYYTGDRNRKRRRRTDKGDRTVRFRAELDLASIMAAWETVEEAAKEPRRFLIKVQIETNRPSGPRECTRYGRVKINLNTIRWTWTPLTRERVGAPAVEGAPAPDNTPIEVDVDGTDKNGFRLEVERGVLREDGEYEAAKSDFTHYLSPDGKVDQDVLFLDPEPWDAKIQPTQQIVTTWWTKTLSADKDVLSKLPMETSIRVQAFPEHKIKKRVPRRYVPEDVPRLAIREIPLHLGVVKWKLRLVAPNPDEPPVLVTTGDSGTPSFEVEVEIFDDSKGGEPRLLKNREIPWRLRPAKDGSYGGSIRYRGQESLREGTWQTDDNGRVKFAFCPEAKQARLLGDPAGGTFNAEFDVWRPGARTDSADGKIPWDKTPNE